MNFLYLVLCLKLAPLIKIVCYSKFISFESIGNLLSCISLLGEVTHLLEVIKMHDVDVKEALFKVNTDKTKIQMRLQMKLLGANETVF